MQHIVRSKYLKSASCVRNVSNYALVVGIRIVKAVKWKRILSLIF